MTRQKYEMKNFNYEKKRKNDCQNDGILDNFKIKKSKLRH